MEAQLLDRPQLFSISQCWSMDFVADQRSDARLFDGRKFMAVTVVDNYSRNCLVIQVGQSIKGMDVVEVMERIKQKSGAIPQRTQVDNGSEFISKALDKLAIDNKLILNFSRPGKATDNSYMESFNGSFRNECLNVNWFLSLEDAQKKVEAWSQEYNSFRPHSSLGYLTPEETIEKLNLSPIF